MKTKEQRQSSSMFFFSQMVKDVDDLIPIRNNRIVVITFKNIGHIHSLVDILNSTSTHYLVYSIKLIGGLQYNINSSQL